MKKIFFALAALAALAACSKSEVAYEANEEIGFVPVIENMTKAMVADNNFPQSEKINLWAYYKPVKAGTAVDDWLKDASAAKTYLNHKTFAYNSTKEKWSGYDVVNDVGVEYFWPKNGSLVFVGYHPETLLSHASHNYDSNTMHFEDISMSRVAKPTTPPTPEVYTEDFMYFNMTPSYASGAVEANFKHALSWISLLLVKDGYTSNNATITVNKVEFTNVVSGGDADVIGAADIVWTANGPAVTVDILEGTPVVLAKDNTTVEPYEPLFIPQSMNGKLIVEYEIKSTDESKFTEVKEITLSGMTDSNKTSLTKWEAGKHYTYTITIGTSEILVDPEVKPWENVTVPSVI
jgi:formylmethanofuran dehydrogenase subunit D